MGAEDAISLEELQLATRNHGMPLEALRYEITPVGLHYLLIHFDIPAADLTHWALTVAGRVRRPLDLSLDELRSREAMTIPVTMECAGNGRARLDPRPTSQPWLLEAVGTAEWTGTPLHALLGEAGLEDDAVDVVFTGLDHGIDGGVEQDYERALSVQDAMRPEVLLAYAINGQPLPPQHGFPVRLVVPGWYGMTSVKWLRRITVVSQRFAGFMHTGSYRIRQTEDEPGTPVTRMMPRALMAPPGHPEFLSRTRMVPLGPCRIEGRAWSGWGGIEAVDVSDDGGATWRPAEVGQPPSQFAWSPWSFRWEPAAPGPYELCCRARDAQGNEQPVSALWNLGGYENNGVQRVQVVVQPPGTG